MISILIPFFNVENYIKDTIESVIAQTKKDWEMILIDDGSTDKSYEICKEYADKDDRIKLFTQENSGVSSARNAAVSKVTSKYFTFLDSDDLMAPDFLEKMYYHISKEDADIYAADFVNFSEDNDIIWEKNKDTRKVVLGNKQATKALFEDNYHGINFVLWDKVYKTKLFIDNKIVFPVGHVREDMATLYRIFYSDQKTVYIDDKLIAYRYRVGSIMHSGFDKRRFDLILASKNACDFFLEKNENELFDLACNMHIRSLFTVGYEIRNAENTKAMWKEYKDRMRKEGTFYLQRSGLSLIKKAVYQIGLFLPWDIALSKLKLK